MRWLDALPWPSSRQPRDPALGGIASPRSAVRGARCRSERAFSYGDDTDLFAAREVARPPRQGANALLLTRVRGRGKGTPHYLTRAARSVSNSMVAILVMVSFKP